ITKEKEKNRYILCQSNEDHLARENDEDEIEIDSQLGGDEGEIGIDSQLEGDKGEIGIDRIDSQLEGDKDRIENDEGEILRDNKGVIDNCWIGEYKLEDQLK
ncbi:2645_t:CDS:2, partial [Racocetra fulgida]